MGVGVNQLFAQALPSPWAAQDIGNPAVAGSSSFNQGTLTVNAAGSDIWSASDQFRFVYQQVSGDVEIIARVDSVTMADAWSKTGVMIRSSLAANAAHGFSLVSAGRGPAFQRRKQVGGLSAHTAGPAVLAPRWVRLVRVGTTVTAYSSADGSTWTTIGSDTIALGAAAYVGLATTSHNPGAWTTAELSQVSVIPLSLPAGQTAIDIGGPAIPGSVSYRQGVYTQRAAGTNIWSTADQFHFIYQQVSGDVDVKARVSSISAVDNWSKAGVMIRESLTAGSRHAFALTSVAKGYAFQRRVDTGGFSAHTSGGAGTVPGWVRLVRTGARVEAFRSANGATWTSMGSDAVPMAQTVYVGIATTSHNPAAATQAVLDNLTITPIGTVPNQPPVVALTSPLPGATFTAPANIIMNATATDADGTIARVEFYSGTTLLGTDTAAPHSFTWTSVPAGTYSLRAIAYDPAGASGSSATATVTVNAAPASPPTTVIFQASSDHATLVTSYRLDVFVSGADPNTATPIATSDLGKPTPAANNDITVNRAAFFSSLAPRNYIATMSAVGSSGSSRSMPPTPFTR